ncbi:substrate-binding domain-containing protein [Blastococcus sp. TF02A-30]|uniref:substrate-binding domain-containing protein n=1 Tax=Blastococcus sp. TF02A-30 TaxID=2250580 RepID=UPI000DE8BC9D|nr:substrate-binding domain-containing protein [Blastococcus sp. TF02A-30]RBY84563.1 VWA domain-containing protein [Blastococcus sp. TF02A-30]
MGRHADPTATRRPAPPVLLIAAGLVLLLLVGGVAWWVTAGGEDCDSPPVVDVTVAPELGELAGELLSDEALAEQCVRAQVTAQEPLQTVGDLGALDAEALPDVWIPDSSLWSARAEGAELSADGAVASSPVVLATSRAAVDALGWANAPPTWGQALTTDRPLAVPDLAASAEGLSALAAVRSSLGGGEDADKAVVEAVLSASRAPAAADALAEAADGAEDAALVPVSEQEVYAGNEGNPDPLLIAVYPSEGSPSLDYPVLRVGSPEETEAVDAVVAALTSEAAQEAAREAGFRTGDGSAPALAGDRTGTRQEAPQALELDPAEVQGLLGRLSSLAKPSRLLAVFDVSTSMEAAVGGGTRATLARDAAKSALSLFPGRSAIGLWVFARELESTQDWTQLVPTRALEADVNGSTQREVLTDQLDTIPGRLSPGGTGLYDTTLAAVRAARADFDPTSVSSVVIITDGQDEDTDSIGLETLVQTLAAEVDANRPVKVIGIALGPEADLSALERIADATGGAAYSAVDENDLQDVLFDALRQRG